MKPNIPSPTDDSVTRLFSQIYSHPGLAHVESLLEKKRRMVTHGLAGSSEAALAVGLAQHHPLCLIGQDAESAAYIYGDLRQILGDGQLFFFPSSYRRHIKYGHSDSAYEVMRAELLSKLRQGETPIIVATPQGIGERIPSQKVVEERFYSIAEGSRLDLDTLRRWLVEEGFTICDYVYEPGEAAFRGSIVDIFSFGAVHPFRIDLFDDEVESLRSFNPESQLSVESLPQCHIVPNLSHISEEDDPRSLLAMLPKSYVVRLASYDGLMHTLEEMASSEATVVEGEGFTSTSEMKRQLVSSEIVAAELADHRLVLGTKSSRLGKLPGVTFRTQPQPLFRKNFDLFIEGLQRYRTEGYTVYFLTESMAQIERLKGILTEREAAHLMPEVLPLSLHEGFQDAESRLAVITDHQLFERYHKVRIASESVRQGKVSLTLKELSNFSPGDYIVHFDHGIGQFAGLVRTRIGDVEQEMVKVLYRNNDYIYVNLQSLHKLSKYRSKDDGEPVLSQLGSGAWQRLKERTKKKVKDIARDLIRLYAARKESEGFRFSPDSYLQAELEASFMYEDTPDQLKATEAVKADMESPRPMDRLICGDVGFGKTEVAIRAAFKAVADSKQVAVLVPTTVLAYQHWRTFSERLKDFPVRVEYFSRARKPKETRQMLEELAAGTVDIVVGTHRLVSSNVQFHDLGLLIIDEEQKFGVRVKEKLRKMQVNVDTLTMSATPIPRTLQFSLMGTRDLSNMLTPPRNRYPVATEVVSFHADLIAEAIEYELSRNGQVYFVHNRIRDIEEIASVIRRKVPDARIAVGHGRMKPEELEELILAFSQHEYDVLVATTIIENGIDVPNANTIFIDGAHRYGLAELHQLRGRVGRSNRKAFCYLIAPPLETLPDPAQRRLRAIESYSELGSGMRIALQDLDIRGAGNVFGAEQSGFISDLGFDAYHKVFDEAVREVKLEEFAELFARDVTLRQEAKETLLETDLSLSFPPDYVPQDSERIELYRELDGLASDDDLAAYRMRLKDRFGAIPPETEQLIAVPKLRRLAGELGIERVVLSQGKMRLFLPEQDEDPFYKSKAFSQLLAFATTSVKDCQIEQNRAGKRLIRFERVANVFRAIDLLERVHAIVPQD